MVSISVVIPLYNKAPHIKKTLYSVLSQRILPLEVIVVDDGSSDGGAKIVESIANPLIRLISQSNKGVSSARNAGAMAAKGSHIAFLDADDYWYSTHLSVLYDLIVSFPEFGLFSTLHEIHQNNETLMPKSAFPIGFIGAVDDFYIGFAKGLSLINSTTACVDRKSLLAIGGFPEDVHRGEDLIVWFRLAKCYGMAHAAEVTAVYNRNAINRSVLLRESDPPGSLVYLAQMLKESDDEKEKASVRLLFSRIAFFTSAGMCEMGDYGGVKGILSLVKQTRLFMLYAKVACLLTVPRPILTYARSWRHGLWR